jgi:hypothetical protein
MSLDWVSVVIVSVLLTVDPTTPEGTTEGGLQKQVDPAGTGGLTAGQLSSTGELNPFVGETVMV